MESVPSKAPATLADTGTGAPPRSVQRPYVWAFRRFIQGPEWKPVSILGELWNLWHERPNEVGIEAQFRGVYYQTVERLRGNTKHSSVKDRLLFILIARFLVAHDVPVVGPVEIRNIQRAAASMSQVVPPSLGALSRRDRFQELTVYELYNGMDVLAGYLALRVPSKHKQPRCGYAMSFGLNLRALQLGVILLAYREAYTRNYVGNGQRTDYRYVLAANRSGKDAELEIRADECIPRDIGRNHFVNRTHVLKGRLSRNAAAIEFAERYFANFDI